MKNSLVFLVLVCLCSCSAEEGFSVPVYYAGALKNMMRNGDVSAKFDLREVSYKSSLYGLGAVENLKGEILILDSQPYIASVQQDTLQIDHSFEYSATLFVYSQVDRWTTVAVPADIKTKDQLEEFVEQQAKNQGLNTNAPFPFRLIGTAASFDWHVINWPDGDMEHSHEKHIQSGLNGTVEDRSVEILGFYSKHHHAVFTHHTTNMHLHARSIDGELVGHLDDLTLGSDMQLLLPLPLQATDGTKAN